MLAARRTPTGHRSTSGDVVVRLEAAVPARRRRAERRTGRPLAGATVSLRSTTDGSGSRPRPTRAGRCRIDAPRPAPTPRSRVPGSYRPAPATTKRFRRSAARGVAPTGFRSRSARTRARPRAGREAPARGGGLREARAQAGATALLHARSRLGRRRLERGRQKLERRHGTAGRTRGRVDGGGAQAGVRDGRRRGREAARRRRRARDHHHARRRARRARRGRSRHTDRGRGVGARREQRIHGHAADARRPFRRRGLGPLRRTGGLRHARAARPHELLVLASGRVPKAVRAYEPASGSPLELVLAPAVEIRGRAARADGTGVPDVPYAWQQLTGRQPSPRPRSAPRTRPAPGTYQVHAMRDERPFGDALTAEAPAKDLRIELRPSGRIEGRVTSSRTRLPLDRFQVMLDPSGRNDVTKRREHRVSDGSAWRGGRPLRTSGRPLRREAVVVTAPGLRPSASRASR